MADQNLLQGETGLDQELRRSASTVSEACLVGDDLPGASILSRSASLLRALSTTTLKASAPKVEPIEIHLSMPDGVLLPIDDLIAAHERVLRTEGRRALEYGGRQGDQGLREWLANDYCNKESTSLAAENIALTSGASGALETICDVYIDPGDVIIWLCS